MKKMASEKWAGFTDEDIERIKTNPLQPDDSNVKCKNSGPLKLAEVYKNVREGESFSETNDVINANLCSNNARKAQHFGGTWKIKGTDMKFSTSVESLDNCTCENYAADLSDESSESNALFINEEKIPSVRNLGSNTDNQELEVFEMRQKRIEAENARRRALINKAIMDKKKRTQAEASKLSLIGEELNHLDSMLSTDVSILRNYIEKASKEFSEAEKRYLKAEKELIEAKFLLFEKMQRKEQLTEHLCAIIEQNENRKANKLVELMKQLEMETIIEDFETQEMQPILSKYCVMNEEAYHCCQTFKPSGQKTPVLESQGSGVNNHTEDSKHAVVEETSKAEEKNST